MNTEVRFEATIIVDVPLDSDELDPAKQAVQDAIGHAGAIVLEVTDTLAPVDPAEPRRLT